MTATWAPDLAPTTVDGSVAPGPPAGTAAPVRRRRRWLRVFIPFLIVAAFWSWTFAARWFNEPGLSDAATLAPGGTGADGSSTLADRLRQHGITITRVSSTEAAVAAARGVDATIFVPTPDYLNGSLADRVKDLGGSHRIVMLQPGLTAQLATGAPMVGLGTRWATKAVAPRCPDPIATAGVAAVFHGAYEPSASGAITTNCYSGAVVGGRYDGIDVIFVGASDPFRNSRIDEYGNSALAVGLLSGHDRLIWVDVHRKEAVAVALPHLRLPKYHRGDQDRAGTGFPTIDAFPPLFWAALLVLLVAAVLLAIARARRLGPPVAEPLPVTVPAAEAISGRGRLYHRIRANESTLDALRGAAIVRLARAVYPFGGAPGERDLLTADSAAAAELVARVAARTGGADGVRQVLYGAPPTVNSADSAVKSASSDISADSAATSASSDDAGLAQAVERLDRLVEAVLRQHPTPDRPHLKETP